MKIIKLAEILIFGIMAYMFYRVLYIRDISIKELYLACMYMFGMLTILQIPKLFRKEK